MTEELDPTLLNDIAKTPEAEAPAPEAPVEEAPVAEAPAESPAEEAPKAEAEPAKEETADKPAPVWGENWRDQILKELGLEDDKSAQNQIKRFTTPAAAFKSFKELNDKVRSGDYKVPAPEDEEGLKRWRAENGVPDSPEGYDLTLSDGLVIGEEDMPIVNEYLKQAHADNQTPESVKKTLDWYYQQQQEGMVEEASMLQEAKTNTQKELMAEWGGNFPAEINGINNFLQKTFGEEIGSELQFYRGPDGIPLGSNPVMLRAFAQLARDIDPAGTVVPGASNQMKSIENEMSEIKTKMGTESYTQKDANRFLELQEVVDKMAVKG